MLILKFTPIPGNMQAKTSQCSKILNIILINGYMNSTIHCNFTYWTTATTKEQLFK